MTYVKTVEQQTSVKLGLLQNFLKIRNRLDDLDVVVFGAGAVVAVAVVDDVVMHGPVALAPPERE